MITGFMQAVVVGAEVGGGAALRHVIQVGVISLKINQGNRYFNPFSADHNYKLSFLICFIGQSND